MISAFFSACVMRRDKFTGSTVPGSPESDTWASSMSWYMFSKSLLAALSSRKISSMTSCNCLVIVSSTLMTKW